MIPHPALSLLCIADSQRSALSSLYAYDHLLGGEPITAPLADSVKVVTILEAAERSMSRGGKLEVIDGG